ncbi:hypothetical protein [Pseudoclavibacter helvolus]|uniref:Uncharacterized protein n=1 Tax=Pseudoclavibacter helvolus TaxID=255205 RepID=A0A7W4URX0_9MICO|nr:hypothetical protein [Pseudoclavibacter helvolus]MBB2958881.1 hypothetical protein [Pseudoclavibacter helvolus]MBB2959520.1 hypothetical protein [Pseudoclavibacter helvolus]
MTEMSAERRKTAKFVMRYLSNGENKKRLRASGFTPTTPLIACEWESTVSEVRAMMRRQDGAQQLFVLIRREEKIYTLAGSTVKGEDVPVEAIALQGLDANLEIGMVYDSLNARNLLDAIPSSDSPFNTRIGQYSLVAA